MWLLKTVLHKLQCLSLVQLCQQTWKHQTSLIRGSLSGYSGIHCLTPDFVICWLIIWWKVCSAYSFVCGNEQLTEQQTNETLKQDMWIVTSKSGSNTNYCCRSDKSINFTYTMTDGIWCHEISWLIVISNVISKLHYKSLSWKMLICTKCTMVALQWAGAPPRVSPCPVPIGPMKGFSNWN